MSKYPASDVWRITDRDPNSQYYGRECCLNFSAFKSTEIKHVVKTYVWENYRLGNRVLHGLQGWLLGLKRFNDFCLENDINSLKRLTNSLIDDYLSYLHTSISATTGRPLSHVYQSACFSALKSLITWCRVFLPEYVPAQQIFTGCEFRQTQSKLKIDFLSDELLAKVHEALKAEDNPYLKYGIIILECTGMRMGDLLLLKTDCIQEHLVSGHTISWYDHKNRKHRTNLPIPAECSHAVIQLLQESGPVRVQARPEIADYLFLYVPGKCANSREITIVSRYVFAQWCYDFCAKHNILDGDGNPCRITPHMFRRTLATNMLSKGVNLKVIQEVLGHSSPAITKKYYADIKDKTHAELFSRIGILGNIQQVNERNIQNAGEMQWFQDNCTGKARLSDGYCTLPIQNGELCGRFLSRHKCYSCSRYITTLADLDAHKTHLAELQEMLDSNIYGVHFASHITPVVIVLKEIIRRLEELKNEQ